MFLRQLSFFCAVLLGLLAKTGDVMAQIVPPDARILVIDMPYFGSITNRSVRQTAIDDMIADIAMFQDVAPSRGRTFVFVPWGTNLRRVANVPPGGDVVTSLQGVQQFRAMREGTTLRTNHLNVDDIKNEVFDSLRQLGLRRQGPQGRSRRLDLHVFAPGWRLGRSGNTGDLMAFEQATQCVLERGTTRVVWPANIELTVEFRVPQGLPRPSASAEAAFIGILTGFATSEPSIRTRGSNGPRCDLTQSETAEPYQDAAYADSLNCRIGDDIVPVASGTGKRVNACRSDAPSAPAIGPGLDRGPVALVARAPVTELNQPQLTGSLLSYVDGVARLGGVEVRPGTRPPQLPLGQVEGRLVLRPGSGCQPEVGGELTLGQGTMMIIAKVSRYYCVEANLPLGEVLFR